MKKRYKFLRTGLKSDSGEHTWKIGEWYNEPKIDICNQGFHCSSTPLQALGYVAGEILVEVEVKGKSIIQDDKECWSDMRIVKAYHWKKADSVALSIFAAELVIENYEKKYPNDTRPRDAIEAAKKVLSDDTEENRSAARSAAESAESESAARSAAATSAAAWSAAESARSAAAWSVARSAAWSAAAWSAESARSAAWSAAESAAAAGMSESAARSAAAAAKKKLIASLDEWFINRIKTLEQI